MDNVKTINGAVKYIALGDSTGVGVGARSGGYPDRIFRRIISLRPESKLINLCVSGATTSDVLAHQMNRVSDTAANLVTVGVGINDIGHGVPLDVFERNYDQILSQLKVRTTANIVVTNIPEISTAPRIPNFLRDEYREQIKRYNKKLEEVAVRHGAIVFDVHEITSKELPAHPEYFSPDGFHPSDEGYALWADTMWPTIAAILGDREAS
jgi:lysophospholipase L1-like esterase